jgi:isopentenyl diphosphate isomerase/L-lactate dehydrogenase-like FMN-dependent dehydrogenase
MENLVQRVLQRADSYKAMVVTVDTCVVGKREKDLRNGPRDSMRVNARNALKVGPQLAARPLWFGRYLRDGMPRMLANTAGMTRDGVPLLLSEMAAGQFSQSPTWEDIAWVRANWTGPLLVKGVLTSEDARRAVDLGCEGVVVSNHGGRQLETAPATIDVLPEIVAAVGDSAEVLLDSGVRRGADVLKAVALGAKAVLIGRPYVWGLALGGQVGVEHVLERFRSEMIRTMRLMGCHSIHDLDDGWLTRMGGPSPATAAPRLVENHLDGLPAGAASADERLNR